MTGRARSLFTPDDVFRLKEFLMNVSNNDAGGISGLNISPKVKVEYLEEYARSKQATILCVGVISRNIVDAVIELSNESGVPLVLIASRRQVEIEEFGGGYANEWTPGGFADYVRERDAGGKILLARDHGGPWQSEGHNGEHPPYGEELDLAMMSLEADIEAGFDILHLDPGRGVDDAHTSPMTFFTDVTKELYVRCEAVAQRAGKSPVFEVGTDEGTIGSLFFQEQYFEDFIGEIIPFCEESGFDAPGFLVVPSHTRVMESRNIGTLQNRILTHGDLEKNSPFSRLIDTSHDFDTLLKVHNADYLHSDVLSWFAKKSVDSLNVAPEFGVVESRALVRILENNDLDNLKEAFLNLSYENGKWRKWMLPGTTASDEDRAIIGGHYTFALPEFVDIKREAAETLSARGVDIDKLLIEAVKNAITRYLLNLRLVDDIRLLNIADSG